MRGQLSVSEGLLGSGHPDLPIGAGLGAGHFTASPLPGYVLCVAPSCGSVLSSNLAVWCLVW